MLAAVTASSLAGSIVFGFLGALVAGYYFRRRDADLVDRARKLEAVAHAARRAVAFARGEEPPASIADLAERLDDLDGIRPPAA